MTTALLTGFIDLHSHTSESDGSLRPEELVQKARDLGLDALAITDHDTLKGYEAAIPHARTLGIDLVCGIELNTRYVVLGNPERVRSLHLLGYFPTGTPSATFQEQLARRQG